MNEPRYSLTTERAYSRLPETMRDMDANNGYTLKHYLSSVTDIQDQIERLIARFDRLSLAERKAFQDTSYYAEDYTYFQATDSKKSAVLTSSGKTSYLMANGRYGVVPGADIYASAMFRTDLADVKNTYGLRAWYYDSSMVLVQTRDLVYGSGTNGPQWTSLEAKDVVPQDAFYVTLSPFALNTSGAPAKTYVDNVELLSNYSVSTTSNLVAGAHNHELYAETNVVADPNFTNPAIPKIWNDTLGPDPRRNLIPNPQPAGGAGWLGPDIKIVERNGRKVAQATTGTTTPYIFSPNTKATFVAGEKITIRAKIFSDAIPGTTELLVRPRFALGNRYFELTPRLLKSFGKEHSVTFVWTATEDIPETAQFNVSLVPNGVPPAGTRLYMWDVAIERGNTSALPYFDGSTSSLTSWAGTAGNSESVYSGPAWTVVPDAEVSTTSAGKQIVRQDFEPDTKAGVLWFDTSSTSISSRWDATTDASIDRVYLPNESEGLQSSNWLGWKHSASYSAPHYIRQVVKGLAPHSAYRLTFTAALDKLPANSSLKVTIQPDSGGAETKTYPINWANGTVKNFEWAWNSPENISSAILTFELLVPSAYPVPTAKLLFGLRFIEFTSYINNVAQISQGKTQVTALRTADPAKGVSAVGGEFSSVQTYPGQKWKITGTYTAPVSTKVEVWAEPSIQGVQLADSSMMVDTFTSVANNSVQFERVFTAPSTGDGMIVWLDAENVEFGNLVLAPVVAETWYAIESRPYDYTALISRPMHTLRAGDVVTYSGKVRRTSLTATRGSYGLRIYSGAGTVVHETLTASADGTELILRGAFVVPQNSTELRIGLYVDDDQVAGQAAYFLMGLEVARNTQIQVDEPVNMIANPGFEQTPDLVNWTLFIETKVGSNTSYLPTQNPASLVGIGSGYNVEDVPDRPDDLPLGATSDLVDPRTANSEWLPWIAQFLGQDLLGYPSLDDFRTAAVQNTGLHAVGSIDSIIQALTPVLTGARSVRVFPATKTADAVGKATQWDILVMTRTSESPADSVMLDAIVRRGVKPAGVQIHFASHQSSWDAVELANPTWNVWDKKNWAQIEEASLGL